MEFRRVLFRSSTMKYLAIVLASLFALSAGAAEPAKAPAEKPAVKAEKPKAEHKKRRRKRIPPPKALSRTQKHLQALLAPSEAEDGDDDSYDDIDIYVSYRRPELVHETQQKDGDLNDHVRFRLWLARQLAMARYHELYG